MFAHIPYHRNQKWILQSFSLISVPHLMASQLWMASQLLHVTFPTGASPLPHRLWVCPRCQIFCIDKTDTTSVSLPASITLSIANARWSFLNAWTEQPWLQFQLHNSQSMSVSWNEILHPDTPWNYSNTEQKWKSRISGLHTIIPLRIVCWIDDVWLKPKPVSLTMFSTCSEFSWIPLHSAKLLWITLRWWHLQQCESVSLAHEDSKLLISMYISLQK